MNNTEIELRNIFVVLRRQIRVIGATFALILGLAGLYLVSVTPTYTAAALVLVDPMQKNLLDPSQGQGGSAGTDNARVDSEVEILRSDAVALGVIAAQSLIADPEFGPRLALSEKLARAVGIAHAAEAPGPALLAGTLARLRDAVTVRRRGLTYLISVSARSEDPDRAAELANAMADSYIHQQVQAKISGSLAARDALQDQIAAARDALAQTEAAFEGFIDSNIARIEAETGRADIAGLHRDLTKFPGRTERPDGDCAPACNRWCRRKAGRRCPTRLAIRRWRRSRPSGRRLSIGWPACPVAMSAPPICGRNWRYWTLRCKTARPQRWVR